MKQKVRWKSMGIFVLFCFPFNVCEGFACMHICVLQAFSAQWGQKRTLKPYPRTGIIDSWEPPCEFWESNVDSLGEHQVLLTTEPSLQPHSISFLFFFFNSQTLKSSSRKTTTPKPLQIALPAGQQAFKCLSYGEHLLFKSPHHIPWPP